MLMANLIHSDHSQLFYTLLNLGMFEEASEMRRIADEQFLYEAVHYADYCLALLKYEQIKETEESLGVFYEVLSESPIGQRLLGNWD